MESLSPLPANTNSDPDANAEVNVVIAPRDQVSP
jgi:hypothetical protein